MKPGVDYPIVMHIYGVHLRPYCALPRSSWESCGDVFYADVIVHGSKFELRTDSDREQDPYHPWTLTLGDYHARAVKGVAGEVQLHIGDEYDLVLPHQKVLRCVVSGLME